MIYIQVSDMNIRERLTMSRSTMSTSKTFIKRDLYKFFKKILIQLIEVKPLGKSSLHKLFHSFTIRTKLIWSLQSAGLPGRKSKITASRLTMTCTWMIVKSYVIRNVYISVAVNSFVKENEILDFSIVSKRQHIQGEQSLPISKSGLASNLKSIWWHVSELAQP